MGKDLVRQTDTVNSCAAAILAKYRGWRRLALMDLLEKRLAAGNAQEDQLSTPLLEAKGRKEKVEMKLLESEG